MGTLNISLLGPAEVRVLPQNNVIPLPPASRDLLAYLILRRRRPVSREIVQETLWEDHRPEHARRRLNTAVWRLRQSLRVLDASPDVIDTSTVGCISLHLPDGVWIDTEQFESAARDCRDGPAGEPVIERLERAVELYRDGFQR